MANPDVLFEDTDDVQWQDGDVEWVSSAVGTADNESPGLFIYDNALAVTPSDVLNLDKPGALYVGVGGDVKVDMNGEGTVTFLNVPSGARIIAEVQKVYSTGTTATDIVVTY